MILQIDSPMMIRPLLNDVTRSELHAVMTGGFSTIAGSVLGAYITFGVRESFILKYEYCAQFSSRNWWGDCSTIIIIFQEIATAMHIYIYNDETKTNK